MIDRETILRTLQEALESKPFVNAMWIGGSDAFDAADEHSDVDVMVDVADDRVEETFDAVRAALATLAPIAQALRIPEPTWHGHSQTFYRLQGAPEFLMIDLAVMKRGSKSPRFNEPEVHGRARVVFDKIGAATPAPFDREAHRRKMLARRDAIAARHSMFQGLPKKEILRGHALDAFAFHKSFVVDPLVELLRMRHCPQWFDWGLRYLDRQLPREIVERLKKLVFVHDLEELEKARAEGTAWIERELATPLVADAPDG